MLWEMSIGKLKKIILLKKTDFRVENTEAIRFVSDYTNNGGLLICLMV